MANGIGTDISLNVNDLKSYERLRRSGINGSEDEKKAALRQAANQFEAMFTQMWLKSQRETEKEMFKDNPLRSSTSDLYQSFLDEQMSTDLASKASGGMQGGALSELIMKQLDRGAGNKSSGELKMPNADEGKAFELGSNDKAFSLEGARKSGSWDGIYRGSSKGADLARAGGVKGSLFEEIAAQKSYAKEAASVNAPSYASSGTATPRAAEFVEKMMPIAKKVAEKFGLDPVAMVAQAALETGWGKSLIGSANNLFGIKASSSSKSRVNAETSEFIGGKMIRVSADFRSYDSVESSMEDYARLITGNKRYSKAAASAFDRDTYFEELQKAGYATDPHYAEKLKSIARNPVFDSVASM